VPYRYLDELAMADVAFEAQGASLEELFSAACDATLGVMVEDPGAVRPLEARLYQAREEAPDMLLYGLLGELLFFKDSAGVLLRCPRCRVEGEAAGGWVLRAELEGERADPARHRLLTDVKAVTLHLLTVERVSDGWLARVVLDI
jgi:SHS2 domain-containing protein